MERLDFCDRHGYPPEVREQLSRIVDALALAPGESLILLGSTPRGEFSYLRRDGRFVPLSDYEFLLVTPGAPDPSRELERSAGLAALEEEFAVGSPLFHVDCAPIAASRLGRLPRIVRHFETKARGVTLAGPDRLADLPDITLANLDYRDVNEIILWRLWSLLLHLPADPSAGDDEPRAAVLNYLACRNGLDLATWLLPWEGVLLPSFRERLAHVEERAPSKLGDGLVPFLRRCAAGKFDLRFDRPWRENHRDAVAFLLAAGALVLRGMEYPAASGRRGAAGFDDWNPRRKAHELRAVLRGDVLRPRATWPRWFRTGKFTAVYRTLAALQRAWIAGATGGDPAADLAEARRLLDGIEASPFPTHAAAAPFAVQWTRERRRLAEFLMFYLPSLGAKRAYLLRTLGEEVRP